MKLNFYIFPWYWKGIMATVYLYSQKYSKLKMALDKSVIFGNIIKWDNILWNNVFFLKSLNFLISRLSEKMQNYTIKSSYCLLIFLNFIDCCIREYKFYAKPPIFNSSYMCYRSVETNRLLALNKVNKPH